MQDALPNPGSCSACSLQLDYFRKWLMTYQMMRVVHLVIISLPISYGWHDLTLFQPTSMAAKGSRDDVAIA